MIYVTTLQDDEIKNRMKEFKTVFPLFDHKAVNKYEELFPASLLCGSKERKIYDDCSDEELQTLKDFFQGCYSFTLFHFIVKNIYRSNSGQSYHTLRTDPEYYYLARYITEKWTERIKAQNFLSDQPIDKDSDFMSLFKKQPSNFRINDFEFRPPTLFGDFFRDLYKVIFLNDDFLSKNDGVDFPTLMSSVEKTKSMPTKERKKTQECFFAFYNPKKKELLFHCISDDDYVIKLIRPKQ